MDGKDLAQLARKESQEKTEKQLANGKRLKPAQVRLPAVDGKRLKLREPHPPGVPMWTKESEGPTGTKVTTPCDHTTGATSTLGEL